MRKFGLVLAAVVAIPFAHTAQAQGWPQSPHNGGYTVTTPGQGTTFVNPNPIGDGYAITRPGQPTTFVNPNPLGGGYTVTTPGQPTTFINPNPLGR
jgi:hypothetical protein